MSGHLHLTKPALTKQSSNKYTLGVFLVCLCFYFIQNSKNLSRFPRNVSVEQAVDLIIKGHPGNVFFNLFL